MPDVTPTDAPGSPAERRHVTPLVGLAAAVAIVALYALSVGPVGWLVEHGWVPAWLQPAVWTVYAPHRWACRHWPAYAAFFLWYFEWWI